MSEKLLVVDHTDDHPGAIYERKFKRLFRDEIQLDLLRHCIYSITLNDPAHQLDHVYDVCVRAKELFEFYEEIEGLSPLDKTIVYHAALMHDLGCRYNRKDHHIIGYGLAYELINRCCPGDFHPDIIRQIAVCILEHRSSNKKKPSTFLSQIVSVADTSHPDFELYLKRAVLFRLNEGMDIKIIPEEVVKHIHHKFGAEGYHWDSYPDIGLAYYGAEWDQFKLRLGEVSENLEITKRLVDELKKT